MEEFSGAKDKNKEVADIKASVFFASLYTKIWNDLTDPLKIQKYSNIFLVRSVKETIAKFIPDSIAVSREVDDALSALPNSSRGNPRDVFVVKATKVTVDILAKHLSADELEHRLATHTYNMKGTKLKLKK